MYERDDGNCGMNESLCESVNDKEAVDNLDDGLGEYGGL